MMWKLRAAVTALAIIAVIVAFVAALYGFGVIADLADRVAKFTCWLSAPGLFVIALGLQCGVRHDHHTRKTP